VLKEVKGFLNGEICLQAGMKLWWF